ncbi:aldose 1-epimerase family protein [Pedobacter sp. SYSU D00535]|uniref:aldose 1-epimerase family protein n=1 Tax=Pedobacter sp. SYSU D00535 TaxID=2810308 RepID=UPI001A97C9A7|nr:aldose 1-epimerase family protein [Pedobacter sp. SYSU D00535]
MIVLENAFIKALVSPQGAELQSFFNKENNLEYLWNGDERYWPRHSPVLFPIVGGLLNDTYHYKNKEYRMSKHGFARDMQFEVEASFGDSVSFILRSSNETLDIYPFEFLLRIKYQLNGNSVSIRYEVENLSNDIMPFSIGAHPAFNIPLVKGTSYEDYYLEFSEEENSDRLTLKGNLLTGSIPYLHYQSQLQLKESLFYEDALIFKDLKSKRISICSDKTAHGLHYDFKGFPYLGIWAARNAPFVCIEPWFGLPDRENHNQNIEEKDGIVKLSQSQKWTAVWSLSCF